MKVNVKCNADLINLFPELAQSVVIFDQTSYWVEEGDYKPDVEDEEEIVFTGTFEACVEKCEQLNDEV